ncbi:MAG: FAD/NAD(P)-binding protein [Gammaproteobacteria bacterium]|nr:FAD/NAD(P)-binding protein [Gammaproteobacteria bacterium]
MTGRDSVDGLWAPQALRIANKVQESTDVFSFELELEQSFDIRPGQFNMLYAFGKGEVPISMSAGPPTTTRLVHTIRNVGKITTDICAREPGEEIELRGPFGNTWPLESALGGDVVIVAGGIGLAPMRPVIQALLANLEQYRRISVVCGARSPYELIFREDVEEWSARRDLDFHATVDIAPRGWTGTVGVVTSVIEQLSFEPQRTTVMTCGPEIMMRFTADAFCDRGVPAESIFLSMERNMKCAVGFCGHCMYGPHIICRDGPVFRYSRLRDLLHIREL